MSHSRPNLIPSKENLLQEIQEKRKQYGISETELGTQLGLNQSQVSKLLNGNRRLLYDEAHHIVIYLTSRLSSIPHNIPVTEFMIPSSQLDWGSTSDQIKTIAAKMHQHSLNQIPIESQGTYVGVITHTSLLHGFLFPPRNHPTDTWIQTYKEYTVDETTILENIPEYSERTPLDEIFKVLMDYNAVILKKRDRMTGMITRNQLLKLAI